MNIARTISALKSAASSAVKRVRLALFSKPRYGVESTLIGLTTVAAFSLPVGYYSGYFPEATTPPPSYRALNDLVKIFVAPSLIEEIIFRAILLPCPTTTSLSRFKLALRAGGALFIFVLYHHPLQTLITPTTLPVFSHPAFLTMAAALGVVCSGTYIASRSLWPPVLIHWATVSVWYFELGGYDKLVEAGYM